MENNKFKTTFNYKLIYIFRINDEVHRDTLKIGDATVEIDSDFINFLPNSDLLNKSAKKRIDSYTSTAGISYQLLHTELALCNNNEPFRDKDIHRVLINSGINRKYFSTNRRQDEWFLTDLQTAKNAITAYKEGKSSLTYNKITQDKNPIIFRPEQEEAIEKTIEQFKKSNRMLWNAKMRFGKTLTALQIVKNMKLKKTIIITHRPVVEKGWFEDFNKIFFDTNDYVVGSKDKQSIYHLEKSNNNYVYFASMQDLRGSSYVGGNFDKNDEIFKIKWDLVIIDEAHEGTKTELGKNVLNEIIKNDTKNSPTKVLQLSGTPFNLLSDFEEKEIYTWDYVMEQKAKLNWNINNYLDSNPYDELPKLNIFTYDLKNLIKGYQDIEDKAFNFREFFKTWTGDVEIDKKHIPVDKKVGDFIHESDIRSFLDLLSKTDEESNYPYSTELYRDFFRHSLWMVPGVKEARALSKILKEHPVFGFYEIVNVAGDGDEEVQTDNALRMVERAITSEPEKTYTITISCGKLTTGVSVPAWTSVLMLSGSFSTTASNYLQTIFRVQTPGKVNGKFKENCYVFDFAPDRTLKMVAEAGKLSTKAGSTGDKKQMGDFLNFCPVISIEGSEMRPYDVDQMLQQLKQAYAERVVRNGFDDIKIYNDNLLKLDGIDLEKFAQLQKIMGTSKQSKRINEIDINKQGLTNEEYEEQERLNKIPKRELTEEQKLRNEELKEKKKQKNTAISILRGISIRIPLIIYGANIPFEEDVTLDNFTSIIDNDSWEEFMPKGVSKEMFNDFSRYYDRDIFVESGRRIRNSLKGAESLPIIDRVKRIAEIFSTFKNPDKETVLTPWRVVNMHLGDTLGGYNFYDENYSSIIEEPRLILHSGITTDSILHSDAKILEINSKTGLYPLYVAYSLYRQHLLNTNKIISTKEDYVNVSEKIWERVLKENIFVICKTSMAKSITNRTLRGFSNLKTNVNYIENLIEVFKKDNNMFKDNVFNPLTWGIERGVKMKFDAIVGNPPYQELVANNNGSVSQANPVYNLFVENAIKLSPNYVTMITPSLWMTGGTGLANFRKFMLSDNRISVLHDFETSNLVFDNVAIAGGVSYFLWNRNSVGKTKTYFHEKNGNTSEREINMASFGDDLFIREATALKILEKVDVKNEKFNSFMDLVSTYSPFSNGVVGNYKELFLKKPSSETIVMYKNSKSDGGKKIYINRSEIVSRKDWIDKHKVYVSKAGEISAKFNGLPFYGEPGSACTETYLVVGPFDSKEICDNVIKYMNTNLYKFLISQIKKTQNAARGVYRLVPNQDFSTKSDIDWSKNSKDINEQLYKKYKLTEEEIKYIESKIN